MRLLSASHGERPDQAPPVRWGILAPGWIASQFVDALRKHTRQQVVAVGSRSGERAREFATQWEIPRSYGSYADLVADPEVDVVYVASPHSAHRDHALLALEAGKPILVEKAFTRNAAEAREVVEEAAKRGLLAMEAMWSRFLPHYDVVRRTLAEGVLGDVTTIIADHGQRLWPDGPDRLALPDLAGGALLDLGIYPLHLAHLALGEVSSVTATGTLTDLGVDAQASVVLTNRAGAQAVTSTTMAAATPTTAVIAGTKARLEIPGPFYVPQPVRLIDRDGTIVDESPPIAAVEHEGLAYEAAEVARCLHAGLTESPVLPAATTLAVMEILDEVRAQIGVRFPGE